MTEAVNFLRWLAGTQHPRPGFRRTRRPSQIPSVLTVGEVQAVFQPIVDLRRKEIFAYETLARSNSPHFESPPKLFTEAIRSQCCGALGRVLREMAVESCPNHALFINIHPQELDEGWLVQPDDPIFAHYHPVFLEITESVPLSHFSLCHSMLREIRSKGVHLAIDDLGAGYSNLKYIADLNPEIVKLDRGLIAGLHEDKRRQKLVSHMVALCEDLGAKVVAEGMETYDELSASIDTGAHYGQGYYFAKPAYPPPPIMH
ncbi:MAG: hypothetical protein CMN30_14600 [Sandaracinus sp.]|nr:hypothetical protein [Sandaracinus sp.]